jgi:hypothetical protein
MRWDIGWLQRDVRNVCCYRYPIMDDRQWGPMQGAMMVSTRVLSHPRLDLPDHGVRERRTGRPHGAGRGGRDRSSDDKSLGSLGK